VPEDQRVPFWNFHILQDVAKVSATDVDLLQQLQLSKKTGAHWDYLQNMTRVSPDEYKGQIQMIDLGVRKICKPPKKSWAVFFHLVMPTKHPNEIFISLSYAIISSHLDTYYFTSLKLAFTMIRVRLQRVVL
jgi:hypothetical protein